MTGANFILEMENPKPLKIMVDCGLIQGEKYAEAENREDFPYNPREIDYLFVTHAHADHIGRVPKLLKDGFNGKIFSTPETKELAALMFEDALGVMRREAEDEHVSPIYEEVDINKALSLWETFAYHQEQKFDGFSVFAKDAGHILGSAIYEFSIDGKKIVFTGDLGNSPAPIIKNTEEVTDARYLIMESVYGDRNHESKDVRLAKLKKIIKEAINRGGAIIIPAFSIERTQVILYELNGLVERNEIPSVPVFLDSPLAIRVTEIYRKAKYLYKPEVKEEISAGDDIFDFPKLKFTYGHRQSEKIEKTAGPKIIIAGGGMSQGGRVMGHEQKYLPDPRSTIILVGYQATNTLGRSLLIGDKEVSINGEKVPVRARIENIEGYSSHMDSDHLIEFAGASADTLKKVFIVMGEPKASMFLCQRLRDYAGLDAICPKRGEKYFL